MVTLSRNINKKETESVVLNWQLQIVGGRKGLRESQEYPTHMLSLYNKFSSE
jgi:hypothetical protein